MAEKLNLKKRKLGRDKQRIVRRENAKKVRGEEVIPTIFPETLPIDQQTLKGNGDKWTERAR